MVFGFVTCGPNEALVVSGCCHSERGKARPMLVRGGMAFVWPFIQQVQKISLNTMSIVVESPKVYTNQGVAISVTGIAQVKIQGQNEEMLMNACQQFLGKKDKQIRRIAMETLEGHQRAIMGAMSVEEIFRDRKKFSKNVFEVATSDLFNMGIIVVSYTIKDLRDEEGYLKALGEARTAEVKRDARIGEAEAHRDSLIREALAEEKRMASRFLNDAQIASARHDYEIKKASYDIEVHTKKAEANLASELQAAKTKQKIKEEEMQIRVIERCQNIQVEEQEIIRKSREMESMIRQPADAERYRMERIATSDRNRLITEAEAEAEAVRMRGEALAYAVEVKAKAEAEQMALKAAAFNEYRDAAMIDMILETTPKIVAEVTGPLCKINKIKMVSGGAGEIGAAKLTNEVLEIVAKVPEIVKKFTNVDITKSLKVAATR